MRRPRERLLEAILQLSGEAGYEQIAVKTVIERAKTSRATFYKHFANKEDCFAQAYTEASEWLHRRLMGLGRREPDWRRGLRVGLAELLEFCANQPQTAKALLIEAHAAGGEALRQHDRLMELLAEEIDGARDDPTSRRSPPPSTATFLVGAIETAIAAKVSSGEAEAAPESLPGLLHLVVMQYYGEAAAWEEMASAPLATWSTRRQAAAEMP